MALRLKSAELLEHERLSRLLLSPLAAPSRSQWREDVAKQFKALFRADRCLFWLPDEQSEMFTEGVGEATLAGFRHFVEAPVVRREVSPDPLVSEFLERRKQEGIEVYDHGTVDRVLGGRLRKSAFHNEVERQSGLRDMLALNAPVRHGGGAMDVMLAVYYDRPERRPFRGDSLVLMRTLLPAYQLGLELLSRFDVHRQALDAVPSAAAVFTNDGREVHRTPALRRLLTESRIEEQAMEEIRRLASALGALTRRGAGDGPPATRDFAHAGRTFRLIGSLLGPNVFAPDPTVLVAVEPRGAPALPSPDVLRARYGFTQREAEVALLLAEGLSNAQLAARLGVGESTARTHTERVLAKAGLTSRKALGLRLLEDREPR